jgi:glycosyltransferase involved in cell wall biosynthesis
MKKVGINLLWMVPGVVGGSETYLARLLSGLAERASRFDYTLFVLPQFKEAHPALAQTFKIAYAPVRGRMKSFRVAGESTWLLAQCRIRKIDLVHHAGGIIPVIRTNRPVMTIHDLQYLDYPEYLKRAKLAWLRTMIPRSAEVARLIMTPSQFTRRQVIERLNIDPSIVTVVPHGISPREGKEPWREVKERYDLEHDFFLYPAITYPHKNHLVLIRGFAKLLETHPETMLVLTGAKGSMEVRIGKEVQELGLEKNVKRLGHVPTRDLDALYHAAIALAFPSRFEGFGAPVLEAMSRSCPVIAADATALPEVVGDAGILVSPDNSEEWCKAMCEMIEDLRLRERLSRLGLDRSKEFTWEISADLLEDAYAQALETAL